MKKTFLLFSTCLVLSATSLMAQDHLTTTDVAVAQTVDTETPMPEVQSLVAKPKNDLQSVGSSASGYEAGNLLVSAGVSFGLIGYGFYSGASGFLPLTANVEYSINDKFAVGGYVGYYSRSYTYYGSDKARYSALSVGARGTFHATGVLNDALDANINPEKVDLYASVLLGFETYKAKYDGTSFNGTYGNGNRVVFGPTLGIRYFITPNIGVYFEGGRGAFGYGTLGVSFKL